MMLMFFFICLYPICTSQI